MRTRAILLAAGLVTAACGGQPVLISQSRPAISVIRLPDAGGITLVDTDKGEIVARVEGGIPSRDWVFRTQPTASGTRLAAVSALGEVAWTRDLEGALSARIAAHDGSRVALLPLDDAEVDPYHPAGRATTALTVVSTVGGDDRVFHLDGNFEPEAFSTSGRSLFVIEYTPALVPESYRVRKLDLDTGEIEGVFSVDGHLQESMRGTARVSTLASDGSRLYTLYTTDGPDGPAAFVHVLDLDEEWAHCVDLPAPVGSSTEEQLAITAQPGGDRVVVVDAVGGIAEIDATTLAVVRSVEPGVNPTQPGRAMAALDRTGTLIAGRGVSVAVFDASLAPVTIWHAPTTMVGLHVDPSGRGTWHVGVDAVYLLHPGSGQVLDSVALPDDIPPIVIPDPPDDQPLQCAC